MPITRYYSTGTSQFVNCWGTSSSSSSSYVTKLDSKAVLKRGDHKSPMAYYRVISESPITYYTESRPCSGFSGNREIRRTASTMLLSGGDGWSMTSVNVPAKVSNDAMANMFADLKQAKANIGMALVEYRKTASFIGSVLRDLAVILKAIKTGKFSAAARRLINSRSSRPITAKQFRNVAKTQAERWLQFHFAVKPGIEDVTSAIDIISNKKWRPQDFYLTAEGRATGWLPARTSESTSSVKYFRPTQMGHRVKSFWLVSNPELFALSSVGFGPADIAAIVWDAVGFSFVFDWFFHVNRWIAQFTATQGLTYINGFRTSWFSQSYLTKMKSSGNFIRSGGAFGSARGMQRSIMPKPTHGIRYSGGQSYWHLATSAALLAQLKL